MSNKSVNIISIVLAVISFLMMVYAGWINVQGDIKGAMILFYSAGALAVAAVAIILIKRSDW